MPRRNAARPRKEASGSAASFRGGPASAFASASASASADRSAGRPGGSEALGAEASAKAARSAEQPPGAIETLHAITLTVNGAAHALRVPSRQTLLDVLRDVLGLTGTNRGCNQGDCGACTVLLDGVSVNACLVLAVDADRGEVVTIEGIASKGVLHPLQRAFLDEGAVQCGYCTPGMIMQAAAFLGRHPDPDERTIREGIEGNLCRCTGYAKIVRAVAAAAKAMKGMRP